MRQFVLATFTVLTFVSMAANAGAATKPDPLYWSPAKAKAQLLAHPALVTPELTLTVTSVRACDGLANIKSPPPYPVISKTVNGKLVYRHFRCAIHYQSENGSGLMPLFIRATRATKFCWSTLGLPGRPGVPVDARWQC